MGDDMDLNKEKLNDLLRNPKAWTTIGVVLVALVGLFGFTFSDSTVAAWNALVSFVTGA